PARRHGVDGARDRYPGAGTCDCRRNPRRCLNGSRAMAEGVLGLDRLSKRFGRTVTADSLSLTVDRGEFFTFLGPSGSGKSTILRMVAGLVAPDSGRIAIDGEDVAKVPPWRRNLGMMFQQ